ncbi:MAG TPA: DegT/DnrJ/EryC1/StrS family aminotransferase [Methylophilaceae bacterium]|jgi:dTDP-4-amino-4,6-dideoxygalactose transaminase
MQQILFANGTSALWASLKALGCHDSYVAVPSTICPSVICAIFASGNRPYFVDIERKRLGLDTTLLAKVLSQVKAVIAVHAMGIPCEINTIAALCKQANVPLIEDCCQSQGAEFEGKPVGQFGDVAVYSYGAGKIIEAGGGGGAETANPELAEKIANLANSLGAVDDEAVSDLGKFYKFFYNQLYPERLGYYRALFTGLLRDIAPKMLGRYPTHLDGVLSQGFKDLTRNIQNRKQKALLYSRCMANTEEVSELPFQEGSSPWRYNIWLNFPARQYVLKRMLQEGIPVSSWSPDISQFMESDSYRSTSMKNSKWLSDGILNLWVNAETSEQQITQTCAKLTSLLSEYRQSNKAQRQANS